MKKKVLLKIVLGIAAFVLLVILLTKVVVEPWIEKKIQSLINEKTGDYRLAIEKVDVSIFRSSIELKNISLQSKTENEGQPGLTGEIESVKFKGIHFMKALLCKTIDIREVNIFNSRIVGTFEFPKKTAPARLSPLNIRIENLLVDKLFVDVKNPTTAQTYFLKDGVFIIFDINVEKQDTITPDIFGQFDIDVPEFKMCTPDSLYTFLCVNINYSATSNTLTADSFAVQPNYSEYGFTDRHQFETDRIEGRFNRISFHDFPAADFVKSGNLSCSYVEIGEMELNVFRDKRKAFEHVNKPTFQDVIYNYPGPVNIDSIGVISGDIVYSEHAENAIEKGSISFNKIEATIYNVTNDTIYKLKKRYLGLRASALLMDKGKVVILLKSRIFDSQNTFAVKGKLWGMEASGLNPILEKNAFISVKSGKINAMYFSFSANNTKATGNLKLLYEGLDFAFIDKQTGETKAFIEALKTTIANMIVMASNPMPNKEVRSGIIEYERDPERFLFSYFVKTLMSGMKTSVTKAKE